MPFAKLTKNIKKQIAGYQKKLTTDKTLLRKIRLVAIAALVLGILYLSKSLFVVAMVNGQPISRLSIAKSALIGL